MAKSDTFSQQCSKVGNFSQASNFTLYVTLTDRDGNSETNKSYVDYNVYCQSNGSGTITARHYKYFSINGEEIINNTESVDVSSPYAYIPIASGTIEVTHNSDGSKSIPFSAEIRGISFGVSASVSGYFELEKIGRYTTVYNSERLRTINSISINWSTTEARDHTQYSLNGAPWTDAHDNVASDNKSGYYTISGLYPNTLYTIRTRCKRTDSQLWSEATSTLAITTYDYAKILSATDFTDEENPTITYSNPFGNNVGSIKACISLTGSAIDVPYREISKTGTNYTFYLTESERNVLRKAAKTNTLNVLFYIETDYNNNSYYSSMKKTMMIVNANPTFIDFKFVNSDNKTSLLTGDEKAIIKGETNIYAYVPTGMKAIAKKYASMNKYRLEIGSQTIEAPYSDTSEVGITLNNVNSDTITMYAIDSRGNNTMKQLWASKFINYFPPQITYIEAIRTDSVKEETTLKFNGIFWNGNFGARNNVVETCHYRYRLAGTSKWKGNIEITDISVSGNSFSCSTKISGDLGAKGFDINNSYEINVDLWDWIHNAVSPTFVLGPGKPALAIYKNKVAIGGKYETAKGGDFQMYGDVFLNNSEIMTTKVIQNSYSNTDMKNGDITFYKIGKIVYFVCTGDAHKLNDGYNLYVSNVSSEYTPLNGIFRCPSWNNKDYIFIEIQDGKVYIANYSGAITSDRNCSFTGCYICK